MKKYERIKCGRCDGHGLVARWGLPDECPDCDGAGTIIRYESGVYAKWPGGPLLGRETNKERHAEVR